MILISKRQLTNNVKIYIAGAIFFVMISTSCVSQKKYDELKKQFDISYTAQQTCNNDLLACQTKYESLTALIESEKRNNQSLQQALDNCLQQGKQGSINISKLVDQINASNDYIKRLIASKSKSDSLNIVLTNNLTKSLSQQELQDVDVKVQKGVVFISLSDNMLYQSGSWEISSKAESVLTKVSKIIKDYPDYDVMIEGNTDSDPISKPNVKDNWDLSALRAAAVVRNLQNQFGVDPKRMTAGGRGQYNPKESNTTESGKAANRRTEIIILPKLDEFLKLIGQEPPK